MKAYWLPPSKMKDGMNKVQKWVIAAHNVWPHTRITVSELESLGETIFL